MRFKSVENLLSMVIFLICVSPAVALIQFNDGGVWAINSVIYDDVWVDYLKPGLATTLNILEGTNISSEYQVKGWEDSVTNMFGGTVGRLDASGNSQVDMSGGSLRVLTPYDSSQVGISGGSIGYLDAYDTTRVTVSGGV